jgi:uncharacterized RDD family membrane protein YckC
VTAANDETDSPYAGLVTRTLAFAVDAAIIDGAALLVGVVVALCLSVVEIGDRAQTAFAIAGGVLAVLWAIGYFTFFWSTTGQTPGNRLFEIRVESAAEDGPPRPARAFVRVLLLPLSALLLCAGFLMILFDGRRRALHDRLAGTVVLYAPVVGRAHAAAV